METMNNLIKKAFTLIELLVVIVVIAILSSLITVSMSGVKEKANYAKAQAFSDSLKNSFGTKIVAEYKFDEGSGTTTNDTWAGKVATFASSPYAPTWTSSGCVSGNCLFFDGTISPSGDYIGYNDPILGLTQATVCIWVKRLAYIQYATFVMDYYSTYKNFILGYESSDGTINFYAGNGPSTDSIPATGFTGNVWHYVCGSFVGSGELAIYIDGIKKNFKTTTIAVIGPTQSSRSHIGKYSSRYLNGLLDDLKFFKKALTSFEIKEQYYAGLNKLLANGGISKEEYTSRINETAQK